MKRTRTKPQPKKIDVCDMIEVDVIPTPQRYFVADLINRYRQLLRHDQKRRNQLPAIVDTVSKLTLSGNATKGAKAKFEKTCADYYREATEYLRERISRGESSVNEIASNFHRKNVSPPVKHDALYRYLLKEKNRLTRP